MHVISLVLNANCNNARERATAMRTQLLERYLTPHHAAGGWTHGLYLEAWTPEPGSSKDSDEALEKVRQSLRQQAEKLSNPPFVLRSFVLDARHRGKSPKALRK